MKATINFNGHAIDVEGTPDEIASTIKQLLGGYTIIPVNPIPYTPYIPRFPIYPDPVWISVTTTNMQPYQQTTTTYMPLPKNPIWTALNGSE